MAYDPMSRGVLLFGGIYQETNPQRAFDDTWLFDGIAWRELQPVTKPPARGSARMVFDRARQRIVLVGGSWLTGHTDTWEWDGRDWTLIPTAQAPRRIYFSLTYDVSRRVTVLYGGLWGQQVYGDTHEYDGRVWRQVQPTLSPPQLLGHDAYYDPVRRRTVLFGGYDGTLNGVRNEVWEYSAVNPGRFDAYAAGCKGGAQRWPALAAGSGDPMIGESFAVRPDSILPHTPTFLTIGASRSSWNGIPLPLDLGWFGMPGCKLAASSDWSANGQANSGGVMLWSFGIPADQGLVGVKFYSQAFAVDPAAHARPFVLSNACEGLIGAK